MELCDNLTVPLMSNKELNEINATRGAPSWEQPCVSVFTVDILHKSFFFILVCEYVCVSGDRNSHFCQNYSNGLNMFNTFKNVFQCGVGAICIQNLHIYCNF